MFFFYGFDQLMVVSLNFFSSFLFFSYFLSLHKRTPHKLPHNFWFHFPFMDSLNDFETRRKKQKVILLMFMFFNAFPSGFSFSFDKISTWCMIWIYKNNNKKLSHFIHKTFISTDKNGLEIGFLFRKHKKLFVSESKASFNMQHMWNLYLIHIRNKNPYYYPDQQEKSQV